MGIALSRPGSRAAPVGARPTGQSVARSSFAYESTWNDLDLMMNRYEDPELQVGLPTQPATVNKSSSTSLSLVILGPSSLAYSNSRDLRNSGQIDGD